VPASSTLRAIADLDHRFENRRQEVYRNKRSVLIAHRLKRSGTDGQEFDVEIYLLPHRGNNPATEGSLLNVSEARYYFGRHWDSKVFVSRSRWDNFAVQVSAYGPFLCVAEIVFSDNSIAEQYRYIDFEMGMAAPIFSANG
jgi:hypothetical protein